MNKKVFFGSNDLRFYYYRYKDSKYYSLSVLFATIFICIVLVFTIIIPQVETYFSIRREVVALSTKIRTIKENINFVNNLDKSLLDSQLQITTRALPTDKDFAGIINAIADAAVRSGVSISDFSFRLDDKPNSIKETKQNSQSALTPILISLDLKGSRDGGREFLTEISEKLPLVKIIDVRGNSSSLTIGMQFFYKAVPKITFNESEPITSISDSNQELIRKLTSWQPAIPTQEAIVPVGSSSAMPLF